MDKTIYCDHCPIFTACFVNLISPLNLVKECSAGIFNDDHWDINKRKLPPLIVAKIDWPKAISYLEEESHLKRRGIGRSGSNHTWRKERQGVDELRLTDKEEYQYYLRMDTGGFLLSVPAIVYEHKVVS